jgi:hypothetical protein
VSNDEVAVMVERASYERVKAQGPPVPTSDKNLLIIHAGHFEALVEASKSGDKLPYEEEGWVLGCT